MRTYIKMMLGAPIINVEVKNEHLDYAIEDSVQIMQKYNYGDGSYTEYLIFTTSAGQSTYDVMNDPTLSASFENVSQIVDFNISFGADGINTLFSPTHILLQENNLSNGLFGMRMGSGNFVPGLELASYQTAMMYIQQIQDTLGKKYSVDWIPHREVLVVTPTPRESMTGVLEVYKKEKIENLLNDNLVKALAIAKTKIIWGGILRKTIITLPGGGTVSGNEIMQEGREDEKDIIEQIKLESEPAGFFIG